MSTHPATRPTPTPIPPEPAGAAPPRARDLTVNKVLAGAGAAATSAVLGSYFGAAGTVAGAALGSVASTVAATIYQRYLDRTRDTLVARIRPARALPGRPSGGSPGELTVPMPRLPAGGETVRLRVEPVPPTPRRRRWVMGVGATVLVFVIGLLAVSGIEWAKGSTLTSGDSGTSVGRVLGDNRGAVTDSTSTPDPTPSPELGNDRTAEPTAAPDPSADPSSTNTPGSDVGGAPSTAPTDSGNSGQDGGRATTAPGLPDLLGPG